MHGNIAATRDSVQNFNFQWSSEWDPRELPGEGGGPSWASEGREFEVKCSIFRPWRWVFIVCRLCMTDDAVLRKQLLPFSLKGQSCTADTPHALLCIPVIPCPVQDKRQSGHFFNNSL